MSPSSHISNTVGSGLKSNEIWRRYGSFPLKFMAKKLNRWESARPHCVCSVTAEWICPGLFQDSSDTKTEEAQIYEKPSYTIETLVKHSLIFPWDERNPLFTFFTSSYNDAKIFISCHCRRKCKRGDFCKDYKHSIPAFQTRP